MDMGVQPMSNNNQRGEIEVSFLHVMGVIVLLSVVQFLLLDRSINQALLGSRGEVSTEPNEPDDAGGEPPYMRRFRLFNGSDEDVSDLKVETKETDGTWKDITDALMSTGNPGTIPAGQGWGPGGHEQAGFVHGVRVTMKVGNVDRQCLVLNLTEGNGGYQDVEICVVVEQMTWGGDEAGTAAQTQNLPRMWLLWSHSSVSHKKGPIKYDDAKTP